MIKNILSTSIPEDNSQLVGNINDYIACYCKKLTFCAEYKEVLSAIENLEHSVNKMGYITPDHPKFSAMSKYLYVNKKFQQQIVIIKID